MIWQTNISKYDSQFGPRKTLLMLVGIMLGSLFANTATAQTAQQRYDLLVKQSGQTASGSDQQWCVFEGEEGPGTGKHIVLLSGDDEYRSEEALPMLGKILAMRHGFKCTVLFAINPEDGTIKPNHQTNIPGMQSLDSADLVISGLRFRNLPDDQMKHFVDYVDSGKPVIGVRTATHSFNYPKDSTSKFKHYTWTSKEWKGGFGQQVLGDTWISHHGHHKKESCRGIVADGKKDHPILRGVTDVWGPSDVYGIRNLPETANVLMLGQVLTGMKPTDGPVEGKKNNPMMPLAWTKGFKSKSGKESRIFCTTMGAATDFESEGLRRLIVNASFWCMEMENAIPESANVDYLDKYEPTEFGFNIFKTGLTPRDYDLKK